MMWTELLLMVLIGLGAGVITAAGYFAVIATVGVVTRFAGCTKTAAYIGIYEKVLCLGGILGNLLWMFGSPVVLGDWFKYVFGFFAGIFVGCFLVSLAEMVKGLPVFCRKINLQKGVEMIIMVLALGKGIGSIFYFCYLMNK